MVLQENTHLGVKDFSMQLFSKNRIRLPEIYGSLYIIFFIQWMGTEPKEGVYIFKVSAGTESIIYTESLDLAQIFGGNCVAVPDLVEVKLKCKWLHSPVGSWLVSG